MRESQPLERRQEQIGQIATDLATSILAESSVTRVDAAVAKNVSVGHRRRPALAASCSFFPPAAGAGKKELSAARHSRSD